jgi:hypothetical protein
MLVRGLAQEGRFLFFARDCSRQRHIQCLLYPVSSLAFAMPDGPLNQKFIDENLIINSPAL